MFYFRINRIKVSDNKEKKNFLGIIGKDLAEVKLLSFISNESVQLPDVTNYISETDESKKNQLLSTMITDVVANRILSTVDNIKDNSYITFGDTGYTLYQSPAVPQYFDWQFLVLESDKHARDTAALVQNILSHKEFSSFAGNLATLLKTAGNPAFIASVSIIKFAAKTITDLVKKDKDDMIGLLYMSLDKAEHYPDGKRNSVNVPDLTGNIMIDYSIYGN
ncbi:MAG TPA: hypothetical protein VL651_07195 [Bacteroidia bacterium]|jgi:hypothetical protein|nr:hypothetical protein [Bacteroidia bacterium]